MKNALTIAKKEWLQYFSSPVGFVFGGLLLVVTNWLYFSELFIGGQADLRPYWAIMTFLLSMFVPAISMNLIAEEKKNSTWEVLLALPIKEWELAVGKFIGSGAYLLIMILISIPVVITIYILGKPDAAVLFGGLAGTVLVGLSYLSLGLFTSSLSRQPIVGFLGTTVILLINNLIGQEMFLSKMNGIMKNIVSNLSLSWRSANISSGLLTANDAVFFASWMIIFIILTVLVLKSRGK